MATSRAMSEPSIPDGRNGSSSARVSENGIPILGYLYEIPAREGRAVVVGAGQSLTIINTHGSQVCDFWAFNATDLNEFSSMPHQHAVASGIGLHEKSALVSNARRPLMTVIEDTSPGVHDTVVAACDVHRYRQLGAQGYHDNCTDNFKQALQAVGRQPATVPAPLNIWMNTPVAADGSISWLAPVSSSGDRFVLRAEIDVVAVMSACPQDMVPINGADQMPQSLAFIVGEGE
ncbi:urea carboxylase-associated family protein [Mesorhizobium huakuii]|uniref:Urea carboxylase-associated family protein n=1 Tax=Mesorhizobium huakuii TaxID=28104 RepID=A0ABZ0VNG3_9HYPH|nr:urea carboxylase-associated family protein [Mesorhizobium huakuii]WQB98487.1 urea carboxylase-associated family protein [Mesorhizobium huakuii]